MSGPVYGINSGPCRVCAFFCRRGDERSKKRPFCAWTGERLSKDHVEPGCRGFHYRQHSAHEGEAWATRRQLPDQVRVLAIVLSIAPYGALHAAGRRLPAATYCSAFHCLSYKFVGRVGYSLHACKLFLVFFYVSLNFI